MTSARASKCRSMSCGVRLAPGSVAGLCGRVGAGRRCWAVPARAGCPRGAKVGGLGVAAAWRAVVDRIGGAGQGGWFPFVVGVVGLEPERGVSLWGVVSAVGPGLGYGVAVAGLGA